MYDVVIVGAGVAGSRTAELVARKGLKVALLEEHPSVGKPVQCAGLVSHRLKSILPNLPDNLFLNEVKRAKFFYSMKRPDSYPKFELKSKKPVYVIDREKLDKALFERAKAQGIKPARATKFLNYSIKDNVTTLTNKGKFESRLLVGADGPNSLVAKRAGFPVPDNKLAGIQAEIKGEFEPDSVELWFGNDVTPDFFAWLIPESEKKARIGLAARKNAMNYFKTFCKKRTGRIVKPDIGGIINFGIMNTAAERVMVVGDAACQVKPLSGGGVVYSLIGSSYCANACVRSLQAEDFRLSFLRMEYDRKWKWQLEKPIKRGMMYSKMLHGSDRKMSLMFNSAKIFRPLLERFDMDLL